jgi:hypothetical protein
MLTSEEKFHTLLKGV